MAEGFREKIPKALRIAVGGRAFISAPKLYAEIGADGVAPELRSTVALLRNYKPGKGAKGE